MKESTENSWQVLKYALPIKEFYRKNDENRIGGAGVALTVFKIVLERVLG
jgi:hypothetical protein